MASLTELNHKALTRPNPRVADAGIYRFIVHGQSNISRAIAQIVDYAAQSRWSVHDEPQGDAAGRTGTAMAATWSIAPVSGVAFATAF